MSPCISPIIVAQIQCARGCKMSVGELPMTRQPYVLILLACLLNLPAADSSMADEVKDDTVRKCITTRRIKSTEILDDRNILFHTIGKDVYHNILPGRCNGLARSDAFSYRTSGGRLCDLDTIRVLETFSDMPGRSCRLGVFHRISKEDVPAVREGPDQPSETKPLPPAEVEDIEPEADESRR